MVNTPRTCVNQDSPGPARESYRAFRMLNFGDLGGDRTGLALVPRSDRHEPAYCVEKLDVEMIFSRWRFFIDSAALTPFKLESFPRFPLLASTILPLVVNSGQLPPTYPVHH